MLWMMRVLRLCSIGIFGKKRSSSHRIFLLEISQNMQPFTWEAGAVFRAAYEERKGELGDTLPNIEDIFEALSEDTKALKANPSLSMIDLSKVDAILGEGGKLSQSIENYEFSQSTTHHGTRHCRIIQRRQASPC